MFATASPAAGSAVVGRDELAPRPRRRSRARSRGSPRSTAASMSTPRTGANPSSAAAIESTPEPQPTSSRLPRLELLQELEAELGRRVRAGAERAAGVDRRPRARPPAASPTAARSRASRRAPAGGTSRQRSSQPVLDVVGARAAEEVPEALLAARVRVGGELDAACGRSTSSKPSGNELEHDRARPPRPLRPDLDRDSAQTAQRNALFSFSKKPSSWR